LKASGEGRELSTTMAIVRIMNMLLKDKNVGKNVVPIVPDESRTFGMEGMFRSVGIWNQEGQNYVPEDHDQLMFYKESKTGQVLQEGINEAGAMSDWIAAATSYSVHNVQTIPFYICYSMFGMQRVLDLVWAAGDQRARGFLIGGTAGRTTLNGEGLQHEDGHSLILANLIPNCISYDPTFQYEVAVVAQDGMRRMFQEQEDVFYYLTVMNENYEHPEMPVGAEADIIKGMYAFKKGGERRRDRACNCSVPAPSSAKSSLPPTCSSNDWGVEADIWGCPSFNELARNGQDVRMRWNLLHPLEAAALSHVEQKLARHQGPGRCRHRLHQAVLRADPPLRQGAVRHAGHRRFRPFRHPREAAPPFRGRSSLGDAGCPQGAGRRRRDRARKVAAAWSSTTLTRTSRTRCRFKGETT
jgi:pyruvate dehydrogenase E1 component